MSHVPAKSIHLTRSLNHMEKILWRLSDAASLNFTMVSRVRGALTEQSLHDALGRVQRRHPLLEVRIEPTTSGPVFHRGGVPRIPLRVLDASADADHLVNCIIEEEINSSVPWEHGPLVRLVWIREKGDHHHLLATFHHVIADALSGTLFLNDLFRTLAGDDPDRDGPRPGGAGRVIGAAMDARLPKKVRGLRGLVGDLRLLARFAWEDFHFGKPAAIVDGRNVPPHQRFIRVIRREFDSSWTQRLVERARQEKTTVHGALSAAVCLSIADAIGHGKPVSVKQRSAVNLRSKLEPAAEDVLGNFVSLLFYRGRVSGHDHFWDLARHIHRQFQAGSARGAPWAVIRLMSKLYSVIHGDDLSNRELAVRWRQRTPSTMGLSNIGRIDLPNQFGPLAIESIHFAVCPSSLVDFVATVASFNGCLNWNFMVPEPILPPIIAKGLVENMVHRVTVHIE